MHDHERGGFSLIGMLITMVCIIVLFTIGMNAINKAVTGQRSAVSGTVHSTMDMATLSTLYQAMFIAGQRMRGDRLPVPNLMAESEDWTLNTTANLYSALIARNYINPSALISRNEFSPYVDEMYGYRYDVYDPKTGVFWDTEFKADLHELSHASFAHMPLTGRRFERGWKTTFDSRAVLLGNRGPKDGFDDPHSFTYGRSGQWGGHVVYGDGRVVFTTVFAPEGLTYEHPPHSGQFHPDNLFKMESGAGGSDAILSFTRRITPQGPELQFD